MGVPIDPTDIVGKKFGKLEVISLDGKKSGQYRYLCECECGKTSIVRRTDLLNGKTKSCGCRRGPKPQTDNKSKRIDKWKWPEKQPEDSLPFPDDIIGEVEGRLTCIKRLYQREDRNWMYLVRCECGHEFELDRGNFLLGESRCPKCKCIARHKVRMHYKERKPTIDVYDIVGKRFGRLTVLEWAGKTSHGQLLYLCQCDCGNQKIILRPSLIHGRTKSCGCLHKEIVRKNNIDRQKQNLQT